MTDSSTPSASTSAKPSSAARATMAASPKPNGAEPRNGIRGMSRARGATTVNAPAAPRSTRAASTRSIRIAAAKRSGRLTVVRRHCRRGNAARARFRKRSRGAKTHACSSTTRQASTLLTARRAPRAPDRRARSHRGHPATAQPVAALREHWRRIRATFLRRA